MPWTEPTPGEEIEARAMAEDVNGGDWNKDYTEFQKRGWILCVRWFHKHYDMGEEQF